MVTDPPYGVEYDPDWRNRKTTKVGAGSRAIGKVANDDRIDWQAAFDLFPGAIAYVWHAGKFAGTVQHSLEAAGFIIRSQIVWGKSRFVISRGDYHWQHEPCWYAVRKGRSSHWQGDRAQSTLWSVPNGKLDTVHSTQKPVEVMRRPMINHLLPGDAVYDPFVGSGTSIIAAESLHLKCLAIEIEPKYCDVSVARWEMITGKKATRQSG